MQYAARAEGLRMSDTGSRDTAQRATRIDTESRDANERRTRAEPSQR